eukprot:8088248-Prorocentrum_lima.AAC.1
MSRRQTLRTLKQQFVTPSGGDAIAIPVAGPYCLAPFRFDCPGEWRVTCSAHLHLIHPSVGPCRAWCPA